MQGELGPEPEVLAPVRVLLVDDEPTIVKVVGRVLRKHWEVDVATTVTDAIGSIRHGARYALILSDFRLPDATGLDLLEALRAEAPAQARRFVLMTGDERCASDLRSTDIPVLQKPFDRSQLLSVTSAYLPSVPEPLR